jgi:hypothetical protein
MRMIQRSTSRNGLFVAPLLDVLAHRDVLRLPMVGLHRPVKIVRPLVLQREQVEGHRGPAVDDLLRGESGLGFVYRSSTKVFAPTWKDFCMDPKEKGGEN